MYTLKSVGQPWAYGAALGRANFKVEGFALVPVHRDLGSHVLVHAHDSIQEPVVDAHSVEFDKECIMVTSVECFTKIQKKHMGGLFLNVFVVV